MYDVISLNDRCMGGDVAMIPLRKEVIEKGKTHYAVPVWLHCAGKWPVEIQGWRRKIHSHVMLHFLLTFLPGIVDHCSLQALPSRYRFEGGARCEEANIGPYEHVMVHDDLIPWFV